MIAGAASLVASAIVLLRLSPASVPVPAEPPTAPRLHNCLTLLGPPHRPPDALGWDPLGAIRVPRHDEQTTRELQQLLSSSPTARQLVAALERVPGAVVFLRRNGVLFTRNRVYGQGRFWTTRGMIYGVLEYQPEQENSDRMLRTIAHELAHAVEIVSHWHQARAEPIEAVARRVAYQTAWLTSTEALETPFVIDVTLQVRKELPNAASQGAGALATIARAHRTPLAGES